MTGGNKTTLGVFLALVLSACFGMYLWHDSSVRKNERCLELMEKVFDKHGIQGIEKMSCN